jgi:plastocyanin
MQARTAGRGWHGVPAGAVALVLLVTGCAGEGASTATAGQSIAASPSANATATAAPGPTATTEEVTEAPPGAIIIKLGPGAKFDQTEISATAGTISIFLDGTQIEAGMTHNFNIGPELPPGVPLVTSALIHPGETLLFTVSGIEAGSYAFWCSIMQHYLAGMAGTLTVT